MWSSERINRFVEVSVGQIAARFGVHRFLHIHHFGEEVQRERRFRFVGVDKVRVPAAAVFFRAEHFAHAAMPVEHAKDAGQLDSVSRIPAPRIPSTHSCP